MKYIKFPIFVSSFLFLFIITRQNRAIAQNPIALPDAGVTITSAIPASPDAAALGKYGTIPVSAYTGVPNISIPLYTIKSGDLTLPVSVSYHSSGNKVEEMASSVGLGWVLNAGGVITRAIRGKPDEELNGFLAQGAQGSAAQIKTLLSVTSPTPTQQSNLDYYLNATADGTLDSEPDVYNYNFAGYSGQFVMNEQGHITVIPQANIVFAFTILSGQTTFINSFTAKTPDGVTYYFGATTGSTGAIEFTNAAGNNVQHAISWYLYKIVSPSMHEIDFTYTPESYHFVTCAQQTLYQWIGSTGCWGGGCSGGIQNAPKNVQTQTVTNAFNNVKLSSITFENGSLTIAANNARLDLNSINSPTGAKEIDQISITGVNFSKTFNFFYYNQANHRLQLDSMVAVVPKGNGSGEEKYSFTYNPDAWNGTSNFLFAQDFWGYYNGGNGASNFYNGGGILVPEITVNLNGVQTPLPGANRASDEQSMLAGMMTQIAYPTGGYTNFTWEANTESNIYLSGTSSQYPPTNYLFGISNDVNSYYYNDNPLNNYNNTPVLNFQVFTPTLAPIPVYFSAYGLALASPPASPPGGQDKIAAGIYGQDANGNYTVLVYSFNSTSGSAYLKSGNYQIQVIDNTDQGDGDAAHYTTNFIKYQVAVNWSGYNTNQVGEMQDDFTVGGLRIQQIADYDGVNPNPIDVRAYQYYQPGTATSSGYLDFQPVYNSQLNMETTAFQNDAPVASWLDEYLTRSSVSNYPLGSTQGSVVGYAHVLELLGPKGQNGENEYFYTNSYSNPDLMQGTGNDFPYAPAANQDWHRGLLLKQTTWKNTGNGTFAKVNEKVNNYTTIKNNFLSYGIKAGFNPEPYNYNQYTSYYEKPLASELGRIVEATYSIETDYTYLSSATNRVYNSADTTKYVQTLSNYQIDTTTYQLTQVEGINSKGDSLKQNVTYANDYTITGTPTGTALLGLQNLQIQNIVTLPIEEITQRKDAGTSTWATVKAVLNTYKPTLPVRDSVYEMRSVSPVTGFINSYIGSNGISKDSHYQPVVSFDTYDIYGNILQQRKVADAEHTYIWSYQSLFPPYTNTCPVADVTNAVAADVAYTNFETQTPTAGNGNWTYSSSGTSTDATAPMGATCYTVSSSNTMVKNGLTTGTTYIVSLWAKSGAAITITGGTVTNIATGNAKSGWTYYEYQVTGTASVTIGGTGYIDEVRLYPVGALMSTYTYIPLVGIASKCDSKSDITYYNYDSVGRLSYIQDQNRNVVKSYNYNYQGQ